MRLVAVDTLTGEQVLNVKWSKNPPTATEVRLQLQKKFDWVWSILETPTAKDFTAVSVYLSPARDGKGRYGSLQQWAVKGQS